MNNNKKKQSFSFSVGQALSAFLGTVIVSATTTAFAIFNMLNTDHFTLIALGDRLGIVEKTFVTRGEFESLDRLLTQQGAVIEQRLDRIENKIDRLGVK